MRNIALIFAFLYITSCQQVTCDDRAERLRGKECEIVVQNLPSSGMLFEISGRAISRNVSRRYTDQGEAWYVNFYNKISVGDTVVKRKGELKFYIYKKDSVLVFPFECMGEVYE